MEESTLDVSQGIYVSGDGALTVSGQGSSVTANEDVFVRANKYAAANLVVTSGASMTANDRFRIGENGAAFVGGGSTLNAMGGLYVGNIDADKATLTIADGGTIDAKVYVYKGATLIGQKGVKDPDDNVRDLGGKISLAPGPLNIGGSYVQTSDSTLQIDLDGPNSFATVDVAGTGAFSAGSSLVFDFAGFRPTVGESFTFFDALGGVNVAPSADNCVNGEFDCSFVGVPSTLDFEVLSAPDTLTLVVTGGTAAPEPREAGLLLLGFAALAGRPLLAGRSARQLSRAL